MDGSAGARLQAHVLDSMREGVSVADEAGLIVYTNPAEDAMFGYARGELVGMHVTAQNAYPPEENARIVAEVIAQLRARGMWEGEWENVRKDGTRFVTHARITALEMEGRHYWVCVQQDVTEARRAEAALRESEARFRLLADTAPVMIWEADTANLGTWFNSRWLEFTGRPLEAELGVGWLSGIHPDDAAAASRRCDEAFHRREEFTMEFRLRRADGAYRWVRDHGIPRFAADGAFQGYVGSCVDVDERIEADHRRRLLADAGALLGSSFDVARTVQRVAELVVPGMADWCVVETLEGEADEGAVRHMAVAHADPARSAWAREVRTRYGPRRDAAAGVLAVIRSGRSELYPVVTPEMLDAGAEDDDHRAALRDAGIGSVIIAPLVARGVTVGAISLVAARPGRYGERELAFAEELGRRTGVAIDNARLFAAEQAARHAAEAAADRTARLQAFTGALTGTRTLEEVAGVVLQHGMAAVGARAGTLSVLGDDDVLTILGARGYPPEQVARFRRMPLDAPLPLTDAVRAGEPLLLLDAAERDRRYPHLAALRNRATDEGLAAIPLRVEDRCVGAIGLTFAEGARVDDDARAFLMAVAQQCAQALDRARLYAAEQAARAAAEQANRAKSDFLATMSHELRTPLNAIGGYVELLEMGLRGPVTPQQRDDLERIRRSQRRLMALINDILNYARVDAGHVEYDVEPLPLPPLLREVAELVAPQLAHKGLRFEGPTADGAPAPVASADRDRVGQIVLNLLSNAIKFTPADGRVALSCADAGDGTVLVRVADTGVGIPAAHLEAVFEPFVQVGRGLTRTTEGTGLGLAIARDLARGMGGDLTAESMPGEGSTFTLRLPKG